MNESLILNASQGNLHMVEYYFYLGATAKWKSLYVSAKNGHLNIVKYLLNKYEYEDPDGIDPLIAAAKRGHIEIVKLLIENVYIFGSDKNEALINAAAKGHLEIVIFLIENSADINADGNKSLQLSAKNGHLEVVKFLLSKNTNDKKYLALRLSVENGHLEIVKILINYVKNINDLHCIAIMKNYFDIFTLLQEKKIPNYDILLRTCIYYNCKEAVVFLLENGALISNNCLKISLNRNNLGMIKLVLSYYNENELKDAINYDDNKNKLLSFLLKQDLTDYSKVINVYREYGIDVYDMVEKEK